MTKLLSTRQAAELIGVKPGTLRAWRCARTGPNFVALTARSVKYPLEDIQRYVAERRFSFPARQRCEETSDVAL